MGVLEQKTVDQGYCAVCSNYLTIYSNQTSFQNTVICPVIPFSVYYVHDSEDKTGSSVVIMKRWGRGGVECV